MFCLIILPNLFLSVSLFSLLLSSQFDVSGSGLCRVVGRLPSDFMLKPWKVSEVNTCAEGTDLACFFFGAMVELVDEFERQSPCQANIGFGGPIEI
jgi:hypothetical protein